MIDLNALLRRRVEYWEYPSPLEGYFRDTQSYLRSLFQAPDIAFVFGKSMPRSGHRFMAECLQAYFGPSLRYCDYYGTNENCCGRIPCKTPYNEGRSNRYFLQKSHDFGFRDSAKLNGKYLIQFRSPIPRLQSNFELYKRDTGKTSAADFAAFAEAETAYFINFYRKWIAVPRPNALVVAYEDLIYQQQKTLTATLGFILGDAAVDAAATMRMLETCPVRGSDTQMFWGLRDPKTYPYGDATLYARLEHKVADACGDGRIKFHYI